MAGGAGDCGSGHGPAPAVRAAPVGRRLPCALRRVLARARQRLLGRHIGRPGLPAASRGVAAQGMVPHDRHRGGRGGDRAADGGVPAGPRPIPDRAGAVGRGLRPGRHAAAQLRGLRGGAGGLHRRDHRQRPAGRHRRPERPGLHAGRHARQRDLDRHRLRRHRPRRHRSRRRAAAPGRAVRRPGGGNRRPVRGHAGAHRADVRGPAGAAARTPAARHHARSGHRRSARGILAAALSLARPAVGGGGPVRRTRRLAPDCAAAVEHARRCRPPGRRRAGEPAARTPFGGRSVALDKGSRWRCGSTVRPPSGD